MVCGLKPMFTACFSGPPPLLPIRPGHEKGKLSGGCSASNRKKGLDIAKKGGSMIKKLKS